MAPTVTVLSNNNLARIDGFFIDCLLSDNHNFDSDVTEFPVESGGNISDNIRNKPLVVIMECLVTNAPLGQMVQLRNGANGGGGGADPTFTAYQKMQQIRDARKPVVIGTSLRTYDNMALQSLSIPRTSGRGDDLHFTATFKQIEFVTNVRDKQVAIVGAKDGGARTFTVVPDTTAGYIFVDINKAVWFDDAIGGWRHRVFFQTATKATKHIDLGLGAGVDVDSLENNEPDIVLLFAGRPELINDFVYSNETVAEHTAPQLKARLLKINKGVPGTAFDGKRNAQGLLLLSPKQYRLDRLG